MKKEELQKHLVVRNEELSIGVSVRLPLENPSTMATASCDNFEDCDWIVTRVWVPEIYRGQGVGSFLLNQLKLIVVTKPRFKSLLVSPGGYNADINRQRHFYMKNGFTVSPWGERLYTWRNSGTRMPMCRAVMAEEILGHPTLSLLAEDYLGRDEET